MRDAINGIMDADPEKFKYSQDPATLNTIDIAPSSIPGGAGGKAGVGFINGLKADPGVQTCFHHRRTRQFTWKFRT